ncbi:TPA: hypothetical protein H1009_02540 [archaeon]|nr:hypothetical protein [Candidatus Naiadarchaeales archaeon SRR2090153.bin461]
MRKVDVAKTADPLRYELVYDARAPEGQIVRDTNRIIKTFTGAEFWPRVKENLSKKWDWLTYKLATATA